MSSTLPPQFLSEVVALLRKHADSEEIRRALLFEAYYLTERSLYEKIDRRGTARVFAAHCAEVVMTHGCLRDSTHALTPLLRALRPDCGRDDQATIDRLCALLQPLCAEKAETPHPPPPPAAPPASVSEAAQAGRGGEVPADTTAAVEVVKPRSKVYDILPPPFEWIDIPAGQVTLEEGGYMPTGGETYPVPAFTIAKYPITNAQFKPFIQAGGYRERRWWTDAGWRTKEANGWTAPRYWTDPQWNGADHPVVGVSWYEAVAFCAWLSEISGEGVTLPTEQQWQRAAQGDDGRTYPWGNRFNKSHCNSSESGIGRTTPVIHYPNGASPYGVMDMAGNVWEWCLTGYESGNIDVGATGVRVLRGGSWDNSSSNLRAYLRGRDIPVNWDNGFGFRCTRS